MSNKGDKIEIGCLFKKKHSRKV